MFLTRLGRWKTNKPHKEAMRLLDMANCDSCGSCTFTQRKTQPLPVYRHISRPKDEDSQPCSED